MTDGARGAEEPLAGGITNAGRVARQGDHVVRPATPRSGAVHAVLRALRDDGFEGVPTPIGIDDGQERLAFVAGDVPLTPYPAWATTDEALASLARLLRSFHDAVARIDAPADAPWDRSLADPAVDPALAREVVLCHNDVELSNVVFRHGRAVALIDLEFLAPGRRVYDLAQLARLCVPIEHEHDRQRLGWPLDDGAARARVVADAYGLDRAGRAEFLGAIEDAIDRIEALARGSLVEAGPETLASLARTGGIEKYDRRRDWWARHRPAWVAALA